MFNLPIVWWQNDRIFLAIIPSGWVPVRNMPASLAPAATLTPFCPMWRIRGRMWGQQNCWHLDTTPLMAYLVYGIGDLVQRRRQCPDALDTTGRGGTFVRCLLFRCVHKIAGRHFLYLSELHNSLIMSRVLSCSCVIVHLCGCSANKEPPNIEFGGEFLLTNYQISKWLS